MRLEGVDGVITASPHIIYMHVWAVLIRNCQSRPGLPFLRHTAPQSLETSRGLTAGLEATF